VAAQVTSTVNQPAWSPQTPSPKGTGRWKTQPDPKLFSPAEAWLGESGDTPNAPAVPSRAIDGHRAVHLPQRANAPVGRVTRLDRQDHADSAGPAAVRFFPGFWSSPHKLERG